MASIVRLDSVSFEYESAGNNPEKINTGVYFIPQSVDDGIGGYMNITFTPLNYIVPYEYIQGVSVFLYCDDILMRMGDLDYIWQATKINNDIPSYDDQQPITVGIDLHRFDNAAILVDPSDHTIKVQLVVYPTADYSGDTPTHTLSDNSIEIQTLNKIAVYQQDSGTLTPYPCLLRVYDNGEWKFARTQNLPQN